MHIPASSALRPTGLPLAPTQTDKPNPNDRSTAAAFRPAPPEHVLEFLTASGRPPQLLAPVDTNPRNSGAQRGPEQSRTDTGAAPSRWDRLLSRFGGSHRVAPLQQNRPSQEAGPLSRFITRVSNWFSGNSWATTSANLRPLTPTAPPLPENDSTPSYSQHPLSADAHASGPDTNLGSPDRSLTPTAPPWTEDEEWETVPAEWR